MFSTYSKIWPSLLFQARAYGSQEGRLTEEMVDACLDEMVEQHQQKQAWNHKETTKRTPTSNNL